MSVKSGATALRQIQIEENEAHIRWMEQLKRSDSESYKCIEALLNLFMNKRAYEQIKMSEQSMDHSASMDPESTGESGLRDILIYL